MFNDNGPLTAFLGALFLGCMYNLGKSQGQKQVIKEWEDQDRDREIARLRAEMDQMRLRDSQAIEIKPSS